MTKLSKISFFLFVSAYNYLWLRIVMFQYFYNEYGNMGFFYAILLAVGILFLFALFPKKLMMHNYEEGFKKSIFKYFYSVILLLENIFGVSFFVYLLSKVFIPSGNYYIMLSLLVLTIVALSYYQPKDVMEISTLFSILGYGILVLTLFFYPNLDTSLLLPIRQTSIWALPLFVFMFIGDNLTFLIDKKDIQFSKLNYILAIFVAFILFSTEYFVLLTNAGDTFFKGIHWVGFISLSIEPISKFIGNFEFAYIFYILICCIFKYAFNLSLIRKNIQIHKHVMTGFLYGLLFVLGIVCFIYIPMNRFYFAIVAVLMLSSFFIIFWFIKECYHARKIEE